MAGQGGGTVCSAGGLFIAAGNGPGGPPMVPSTVRENHNFGGTVDGVTTYIYEFLYAGWSATHLELFVNYAYHYTIIQATGRSAADLTNLCMLIGGVHRTNLHLCIPVCVILECHSANFCKLPSSCGALRYRAFIVRTNTSCIP